MASYREPIPIPGSRLYRAFCSYCREPIRITLDDLSKSEVFCERCDGKKPPAFHNGLTPRQAAKLGKTSA